MYNDAQARKDQEIMPPDGGFFFDIFTNAGNIEFSGIIRFRKFQACNIVKNGEIVHILDRNDRGWIFREKEMHTIRTWLSKDVFTSIIDGQIFVDELKELVEIFEQSVHSNRTSHAKV